MASPKGFLAGFGKALGSKALSSSEGLAAAARRPNYINIGTPPAVKSTGFVAGAKLPSAGSLQEARARRLAQK